MKIPEKGNLYQGLRIEIKLLVSLAYQWSLNSVKVHILKT